MALAVCFCEPLGRAARLLSDAESRFFRRRRWAAARPLLASRAKSFSISFFTYERSDLSPSCLSLDRSFAFLDSSIPAHFLEQHRPTLFPPPADFLRTVPQITHVIISADGLHDGQNLVCLLDASNFDEHFWQLLILRNGGRSLASCFLHATQIDGARPCGPLEWTVTPHFLHCPTLGDATLR